jgi:site-specific DNA recombinase
VSKSRSRKARPTNKPRGNRLLGYIRVSSVRGRDKVDDGERFLSPDVQKNDQLKWAAAHDCVIVGWVEDLDKTGTEASARQIADAIDRVAAGEADGILVRKVDRWGRNTLDSLLNIKELQAAGGWIASTTEDLEHIDTPAGNLSLTILLAVAEMFSRDMAKGWRSIHDYRRDNGVPASGGKRWAYVRKNDVPEDERHKYEWREGTEYAVDPSVAPWVGKVLDEYLGGRSLWKIADALNEAGVLSANGTGWSYRTLKRVLEAGFYAGLVYTERDETPEWLPGKHEAIVDEDRFWEFQRKLHDGTAPRNKHATTKLARLVFCDGCGRRMGIRYYHYTNGTPKVQWFCQRKPGKGSLVDRCPTPASILLPLLEQEVYEWLMTHAEGQAALDAQAARARRAIQAEKDVATIERELTRLRKRLSKLADLVLDGVMPGTAAKIKERELLDSIATLERSKRESQGDVKINSMPNARVFGALQASWDLMEPSMVNEGLHKVVQAVIVTKAGARGVRAKVRVIGRWEDPPRLEDRVR